jgi:hypothetical protein
VRGSAARRLVAEARAVKRLDDDDIAERRTAIDLS